MSELRRKALHLLLGVVPLAYLFMDRAIILAGLALGWVGVTAIEGLRLRVPRLNAWLLRLFEGIYRREEAGRVSGVFHAVTAMLLTVVLFKREVAIAALWALVAGDAAAALVGRRWGRHRWGVKSLEGTAACWVVSVAGAVPFVPFPVAMAGAAAAAAWELMPARLNDNLGLPLAAGTVMTALL